MSFLGFTIPSNNNNNNNMENKSDRLRLNLKWILVVGDNEFFFGNSTQICIKHLSSLIYSIKFSSFPSFTIPPEFNGHHDATRRSNRSTFNNLDEWRSGQSRITITAGRRRRRTISSCPLLDLIILFSFSRGRPSNYGSISSSGRIMCRY